MDVKHAMNLAGTNLLNCLNREKDYLPNWELRIAEDGTAHYQFQYPAHNIGRWWDAILRLEHLTGFEIPADIEAAMLRNAYRFFDNPDGVLAQPVDLGIGEKTYELHSLREGLIALTALIRFRDSSWARKKAKSFLQTVTRALRDDFTWDMEQFATRRQILGESYKGSFCVNGSHGRLIEALVWHYQETADTQAFDLASRLARFHFESSTTPEGTINPVCKADHTHSYFGTLRGLLLFGSLVGQREFIDRVLLMYHTTVKKLVKESGYTSHDMGYEGFGETSSGGDAAQMALWLALEGHPELLDDAERILRARLLPSQITTTPPITPKVDDGRDCHRDLAARAVGGFNVHGKPHGPKGNVTDVTAADLHSLCDMHDHTVVRNGSILKVLFHANYHDRSVDIDEKRGREAQLIIRPHERYRLLVRIPAWTDRSALVARINEQNIAPSYVDSVFLDAGTVRKGDSIEIRYALPERTVVEPAMGTEYTLRWKGDEVTSISPNLDLLPFYP
ncbi:MAG: hypothetical protein GF331_13855 [Chitinivibrionales bacterium]|nr:hypothetical protein [Chitinivibrionales bacterium]